MSTVALQERRSQSAGTDLIIRDALESDLPAIIDIYNATVPTRVVTADLEPTTVEARLPWFREHSPDQHPFWVAESGGCVIGWLDFKKFLPRCAYRGTAEISVYVDEKFRRRGVRASTIRRSNRPCVVTRDQCHGWPDLRAQRTEPEIIRSARL